MGTNMSKVLGLCPRAYDLSFPSEQSRCGDWRAGDASEAKAKVFDVPSGARSHLTERQLVRLIRTSGGECSVQYSEFLEGIICWCTERPGKDASPPHHPKDLGALRRERD